MIEGGFLHILELIMKFAIAPVLGFVWYFHRRNINKVDNIETRVSILEKDVAVMASTITGMREDIREIRRGVEKLISRSK